MIRLPIVDYNCSSSPIVLAIDTSSSCRSHALFFTTRDLSPKPHLSCWRDFEQVGAKVGRCDVVISKTLRPSRPHWNAQKPQSHDIGHSHLQPIRFRGLVSKLCAFAFVKVDALMTAANSNIGAFRTFLRGLIEVPQRVLPPTSAVHPRW